MLFNALYIDVLYIGRLSDRVCLSSLGGGGQYLSPGFKCVGAEEHSGPDPFLLPLPHEPGNGVCVCVCLCACLYSCLCVCKLKLQEIEQLTGN